MVLVVSEKNGGGREWFERRLKRAVGAMGWGV
jgi:hypothetical protein